MDKHTTIIIKTDDQSALANALRRWFEEGLVSIPAAPVARWTSYLNKDWAGR